MRQVVDTAWKEGARSTLAKAMGRLDEAVAVGYAAARDVVEVGAETNGFAPGDPVAVAGVGYATHAGLNSVPRNLCVRLPPSVSYADGAFATLGAIALQAVRRTQPLMGERVVVIGLGLIGLLTVQLLKAGGCAVLRTDLDGERVALATALGADVGVGPDDQPEPACEAFTGGRGADAVIVAAATPSSEPVMLAAHLCRPKGRVIVVGVVGMDLSREPFYRKELDLRLSLSCGPGRHDPAYEERGQDYPFPHVRFTEQRNMESFLYLVEQGRVSPAALVTHRLAFDDAVEAYALLDDRASAAPAASRSCLGIVLEYPSGAPANRTLRLRDPIRQSRPGPADIGVGVIGAGSFARGVLLPRLARQAGVRFAGVCTRRGATAADTARRFRFAVATTDPAELFASADVDAVVIATRHATHASLTATALRAGKHVFVEKPLCLTEAELADVERALGDARAAGHDPCLMVGFNRRFSRHARTIRAAFAERDGSLATIQYVAAGNRRLPKERCEVFVDGATALVDDFRTTRFYGGRGRTVRGRQAKGFSEELSAFVEACRGGGPWPISWSELAATHRVCFGALRSLETGAIVRLPQEASA